MNALGDPVRDGADGAFVRNVQGGTSRVRLLLDEIGLFARCVENAEAAVYVVAARAGVC